MKITVTVISFVLSFLGFIYLDMLVVNAIIDAIPKSAEEWLSLIKIVLWVIIVCLTFGLALGLSSMISLGVMRAID